LHIIGAINPLSSQILKSSNTGYEKLSFFSLCYMGSIRPCINYKRFPTHGKIFFMTANRPAPGERFNLLYRISQIFNSTLDMEEFLDRVMDEVIEATGAEHGFIVSRNETGALEFQVARGIDQENLLEDPSQVSHSVIEQVLDTWEPVLTHEATSDSRFSGQTSVVDLRLKSILCVPLQCKGELQGVIYVENRVRGGIFTDEDTELLTAIAANASVALENLQLVQDLQEQIRTLNLLYEISSDLTSQLDLDQILTATLQRVQAALGAPAASLLTVEGDKLVFQVALGEVAEEIKPFSIPIDQGIAGWVVQNAQGVIVNDVQNDPRFYSQPDAKSGFTTKNLIAAPLLVKEHAIGVIELFNKEGGFSDADLVLLSAIASSASIAIDNARLYQEAVEKGRLERELQMALTVQRGLLPDTPPKIPGWAFAANWQPAREVSGDFYDFIPLDAGPDSTLGLVIADVTDKGMPAALFMAYTRSILRANLHQIDSPSEAITRANRLICHESTHGLFVTLFYGPLDTQTGELLYVNAGHNPPLLYTASRREITRLMPTGIPLGVVQDFEYKQGSVRLLPGDFIFCYTDGITEPIDPDETEFGLEMLEKLIFDNRYAFPHKLADIVDQAVDDFTQSEELFDDKTIVVLKRTPRKMASSN
jgi:serine phosphatase RsbU (regulator of sigma subunit)/putative methionine-R-sulfoxide reductase with GAF domain